MKKGICILLVCAMMCSSVSAMAALIGGGQLESSDPKPAMGIGSGKTSGTEETRVGMSIGSSKDAESEPAAKSGMGIGGGKKDEPAQEKQEKSIGLGDKNTAAQTVSEPAETDDAALEAKKEIWLNKEPHYYPQLSDAHKAAWEKNIENVLNYPDQVKAPQQDRRYQALASMIKTDNPRIFWIDWIDSNARLRFETGSNATYAPLEIPGGKTLAQMQEAFLAGIDQAVSEISKNLGGKKGTRDKAKAIHDWLCRSNSYNDAQTSKHKKEHDPVSFAYLAAHSAYSAIIKGDEYEPVCEGYATAFKVLCDEFDVPCICVSGSTNFASAHMWNLVQLEDGQWYLVDATSDDVEKSGVEYVHQLFLVKQGQAAKFAYTPNEYLNSGVNPANGYTEGAAFTVPDIAK